MRKCGIIEFTQEIVFPDKRELPYPLGSEELKIEQPIVYRRGPVRTSTTSVVPLARRVSTRIVYGPKLLPQDRMQSPTQSCDCPFCYPGTPDHLQDPRYTWCDAPWCSGAAHYPLRKRNKESDLYVGVRPDYYSQFQHVLFKTGDHVDTLKTLAAKPKSYLCDFLQCLQIRSQKVPASLSEGHSLVGGITFGLSWGHFHVNMGLCPSWVPASHGYGPGYWRNVSVDSILTALQNDYKEMAKQCQKLRDFPECPELVIRSSDNFLWVSAFAGRSEHECTVFAKHRSALSALANTEIKELSEILWTIICYYQSIGAGDGRFLLGFHSLLRERKQTKRHSGPLVFEIMPSRNIGYIEACHGSYVLGDWPENVAARLRAFDRRLN